MQNDNNFIRLGFTPETRLLHKEIAIIAGVMKKNGIPITPEQLLDSCRKTFSKLKEKDKLLSYDTGYLEQACRKYVSMNAYTHNKLIVENEED